MNLTVRFEGHVEDIINKLVKKGVVSTKTEALRLGVLRLERDYLAEEEAERKFDEWAVKEVDRIDKMTKEGKMKTYNQKEFDKMFPHLVKKDKRNR